MQAVANIERKLAEYSPTKYSNKEIPGIIPFYRTTNAPQEQKAEPLEEKIIKFPDKRYATEHIQFKTPTPLRYLVNPDSALSEVYCLPEGQTIVRRNWRKPDITNKELECLIELCGEEYRASLEKNNEVGNDFSAYLRESENDDARKRISKRKTPGKFCVAPYGRLGAPKKMIAAVSDSSSIDDYFLNSDNYFEAFEKMSKALQEMGISEEKAGYAARSGVRYHEDYHKEQSWFVKHRDSPFLAELNGELGLADRLYNTSQDPKYRERQNEFAILSDICLNNGLAMIAAYFSDYGVAFTPGNILRYVGKEMPNGALQRLLRKSIENGEIDLNKLEKIGKEIIEDYSDRGELTKIDHNKQDSNHKKTYDGKEAEETQAESDAKNSETEGEEAGKDTAEATDSAEQAEAV